MNALLTLLGVGSTAHAGFTHTQYVWKREQFPLQWTMASALDDDLDPAYQEEVLQTSWANWEEGAPCADLSDAYGGLQEFPTEAQIDGAIKIYWDDPSQNVGAGILGVTYPYPGPEQAFELNGKRYYYTYDSDIVFNDLVAWASTPDIEDNLCVEQYSIEGVATHELGHLWGLDHTCEEGDNCPDPLDWQATMYWSGGPCDLEQQTLNEYDIAGVTALYGPYATFTSDSNRYGGVPLEVAFELLGNEQAETELSGLSWNFGDGQTSTEIDPVHTYTEQGQYTVSITLEGEGEQCGDWSYSYRERAYVVACEAPQPGSDENGDAYEGMFTYDHYDGLTYQMVNRADTSVYGCIDDVRWDVYEGDELLASLSAWSPKIDFSDGVHGKGEGTYRVVLTLHGPGGAAQEEIEIEAVDHRGEGVARQCGAVTSGGASTAGSLSLVLLGLGLTAAQRRRST